MRPSRFHFFPPDAVTVFIVTWALISFIATSLHAEALVPRILVLNSYNIGYDWSDYEMEGVQNALSKAFPRIELYVEHLDTKNYPGKQHFPAEASLLEYKYSHHHLDVIIAMDNAALNFALQYRQRISPGTPLVFCGINDYDPSMIVGQSRITGVAEYHDSVGTLDMALQVHPSTRNVIVIHDYTDTGLAMRHELEKVAQRYPAVKFQFMQEMPLEETVNKLRGIAHDSLVLMLSYTVEKSGRTFIQAEAARLVSSASPVPVYAVHAPQLGNGVVGGRMMEGQIQGKKAAELAVRVIGGEPAENIPVITSNLSRPMFDYSVLTKFDINPAELPVDSFIINKPASTFAISKRAAWLGSLFTLFCTVSLMAMILNIRKRRRLEEMLREQIGEYHSTHDQLLETEEKLRIQLRVVEESSQKFQAVFEHSPITVILTSLAEGVLNEVNQTFVDMFGYSRGEAIGKSTVELGLWLHEADRNRYLKLLQDNDYVHNFETEMRRRNSEEFTVLFSGILLEIEGNPCVLSTIMDITEQKKLQTQLNQSQKMDVVGQLAGGIAHDFNNMLAGIMAAAELLKRRLAHDEKNRKIVEIIIEAASRSADLTRELLTFSRKDTALSTPVRIHETIDAVINLLKRTVDKQILLSARLEGSDPVVMGDKSQLQNALLNLGVNARDAMPQGGTLTYSTTDRLLDKETCRSMGISLEPGHYLELSVSDTGIGMTKTVLEHIYEPFFTTKEVGKGTGLGLATVYGTVKNHGGEISVHSQPGVGSVFTLFLPLVNADSYQLPHAEEDVTGSGGILLVDDEEILRLVGRDLLEDLGYTVYLAENGEHALKVFADHRSDISLVILDMVMPKMGGSETFLQLRDQNPELKVLFCSGFSREGTGDKLAGLGGNGFIQKPYNRNEMGRAVASILRHE